MTRATHALKSVKPVGTRRRLAILTSLLLSIGLLGALPVTPFGALEAKASVSAGDVVFVQTVPALVTLALVLLARS